MNKEQIIDEVYERYWSSIEISEYDGIGPTSIKLPILTKEEIINKCKTDPGFSEKWGLKIEERELSLEERQKLYEGEFTPGIKVINDHWLNSKLTTRNIPTKLITLTNNNETIESYE
jgi:hypothetical protein